MNYAEMMLANTMISTMNKLTTGNIIIDIFMVLILCYISQNNFKNKLSRLTDTIYNYFDYTNKLVFLSNDKGYSNRFKAIMHFISKLNHPTIKVLSENVEKKYNHKTDDYDEGMTTNYKVDQSTEFYITKNINGKVYSIEKEKAELGGRITFSEVTCLEIYSKKMKLTEMEQWVEDRLKEYNDFALI